MEHLEYRAQGHNHIKCMVCVFGIIRVVRQNYSQTLFLNTGVAPQHWAAGKPGQPTFRSAPGSLSPVLV